MYSFQIASRIGKFNFRSTDKKFCPGWKTSIFPRILNARDRNPKDVKFRESTYRSTLLENLAGAHDIGAISPEGK